MYKSDIDIEKEFSGFIIKKIEWRENQGGGWVDIFFPIGGEHVGGGVFEGECTTGFTVYSDGGIAFDHWFPESIYKNICDAIKKAK